ncbi:MAG: Crp/Fnr family transcriptional regulator [Desulfobacteraceae bacterium]|jgi:CRP/FNR family transcriptional regulator
MNNLNDIIANTPLFGGLSDEQLSQISGIAQEKRFKRGQAIFWEGDPGIGFYVVVEGKIKVYKTSSEGKEQILHIYGPGHPFGEVPVFSGSRFPANAMAIEKSRMLFFPRQDFVDLISKHPSLALNMLAVLSVRLRQFTVQVENLSLKEVPARLASYLLYLAQEQDSPDIVTLPISKGQLASLLGTIPETLSRIFNKMTQQDLIAVRGSKISLIDPDGIDDLSVNGRLGER